MDGMAKTWLWPERPYRGLDFYREEDAALFRERDEDVRACAQLLTSFGTKILILQGYSGVGKSSFLRAGLIPYLKPRDRPAWFFLPGKDSVIRCTADPLYAIATALIATIESGRWFADSIDQEDYPENPPSVGETKVQRPSASARLLASALTETRKRLARVVLESLTALSANLPGKLVLVLDQGEEVLTHGPIRQDEDGPRPAFFRLIEGIYLRNIDIRVIIALRTEYYGRFRDDLRIRDDRLSNRPKSGGVEPFLLRSLRKPTALRRTIVGPTSDAEAEGNPRAVYDFTYADGVAERIVDDLLAEYPNASVTPALQLVCSSLHQRLNAEKRQITHQDYADLQGVAGIVGSYIARGIEAIHPRMTRDEADRWRLLLHSLVSRQGGGVVVSLAERQTVLVQRARDQFGLECGDQVRHALKMRAHWFGVARKYFALRGVGWLFGWPKPAIASVLEKLTTGAVPLLRHITERPDRVLTAEEEEYSLKHDTLAAALARWYDEHGGAIKAAQQEKRKQRTMLWSSGIVLLVVCVAAMYVFLVQGHDFVAAQDDALSLRNVYAERAPTADYGLSLLLLLANLDDSSMRKNLYERITGANQKIYSKTEATLRETLPRVPWFAGHFLAAGVDPAKDRIALLNPTAHGDTIEILTLSAGNTIEAEPRRDVHILPELPSSLPKQRLAIAPAVGFVDGLGPVVSRAGMIYFWDRHQGLQQRDLWNLLPNAFTADSPPRIEFVAGTLQIRRTKWQGGLRIWVMRLDRSNLEPNPPIISRSDPPLLTERSFGQPIPVFSEGQKFPQLYGYFDQPKPLRPPYAGNLLRDPRITLADLAGNSGLMRLDLVLGTINGAATFPIIGAAEVAPEPPYADRLRYTMGFADNAAAVAVKLDVPDIDIYDLTKVGSDDDNNNAAPPSIRVHVIVPPRENIARPANIRILYPLLALAKVSKHWRVAWLAPGGVEAVESSDADPGTARNIQGGLLISGKPGGSKLSFTRDGQYLTLFQQQQWRGPVDVRIWDLRRAWREWISKEKADTLRPIACRIVVAGGGDGKLTPDQMALFRIDAAQAAPCRTKELR